MVTQICISQSSPLTKEVKDTSLNLFNMDKKNTTLSVFDKDINVYNILEDCIKKNKIGKENCIAGMNITEDGIKGIKAFILKDKELKTSFNSILKQLQSGNGVDIYQRLFVNDYSPLFRDGYSKDNSRKLKRDILWLLCICNGKKCGMKYNLADYVFKNLADIKVIEYEFEITGRRSEIDIAHYRRGYYLRVYIEVPNEVMTEYIKTSFKKMQDIIDKKGE